MTSRNTENTTPNEVSREDLERICGGTTALRAAPRKTIQGDGDTAASTMVGENLYVSSTGPEVWS